MPKFLDNIEFYTEGYNTESLTINKETKSVVLNEEWNKETVNLEIPSKTITYPAEASAKKKITDISRDIKKEKDEAIYKIGALSEAGLNATNDLVQKGLNALNDKTQTGLTILQDKIDELDPDKIREEIDALQQFDDNHDNIENGEGQFSLRQVIIDETSGLQGENSSPKATGKGAVAFGGIRLDKDYSDLDEEDKIPTEAAGLQSFAAGACTYAGGSWNFVVGKDSKTYQGTSAAIGAANQSGMTKDEFNEYWSEKHGTLLIPKYIYENGKLCPLKSIVGTDANGTLCKYDGFSGYIALPSYNKEAIPEGRYYKEQDGKLKYLTSNWSEYKDVIYYEDSGREYERSYSFAFAANSDNIIHGKNSSAFGSYNRVYGKTSTSFGGNNIIEKGSYNSITGGYSNTLKGESSLIMGSNIKNYGNFTVSTGSNNIIGDFAKNAIISGSNLITATAESVSHGSENIRAIFGQYNSVLVGDELFVIGNGESETNRSNALELKSDSSLKLSMLSAKGQPEITDAKKPQATGEGAIAFGGFRGDKPGENPTELPEDISSNDDDTTTLAYGIQSFAFGAGNRAYGNWSVAGGKDSRSYQQTGIAIGGKCQAGMTEVEFNARYSNGKDDDDRVYSSSYSNATAFGSSNKARAKNSSAFGDSNTVDGKTATSFGQGNIINETASLAFASGYLNRIGSSIADGPAQSGNGSVVFGNNNTVLGTRTIVFGSSNTVQPGTTDALISGSGLNTYLASGIYGTDTLKGLFGTYNAYLSDNDLFVIGNGNSNQRSNAFEVLKNGTTKIFGNLHVGGGQDTGFVYASYFGNESGAGWRCSTSGETRKSGIYPNQKLDYITLDADRVTSTAEPTQNGDVLRWEEKVELENKIDQKGDELIEELTVDPATASTYGSVKLGSDEIQTSTAGVYPVQKNQDGQLCVKMLYYRNWYNILLCAMMREQAENATKEFSSYDDYSKYTFSSDGKWHCAQGFGTLNAGGESIDLGSAPGGFVIYQGSSNQYTVYYCTTRNGDATFGSISTVTTPTITNTYNLRYR